MNITGTAAAAYRLWYAPSAAGNARVATVAGGVDCSLLQISNYRLTNERLPSAATAQPLTGRIPVSYLGLLLFVRYGHGNASYPTRRTQSLQAVRSQKSHRTHKCVLDARWKRYLLRKQTISSHSNGNLHIRQSTFS